jgi:hypothetical protein
MTFATGAVLALVSCSRSSDPGSTNLNKKLVAQWPSSATNPAQSIPAYPVALTGGVQIVAGRVGQAFSFDGRQAYAVVAHSPDLDFGAGQDFSVMAWIKPEHADTSFGVMPIVEKRKVGGITTAVGWELCVAYGRLAFQLTPAAPWNLKVRDFSSPSRVRAAWQRKSAMAVVSSFHSPGPELRDGEFHHVAVTVRRDSKSGGSLYVDGVVVMTFDPTKLSGSLANKEPLLIGTHPDTTLHCPYQGMIEDIRLYSRALSAAEIEAASRRNELKR